MLLCPYNQVGPAVIFQCLGSTVDKLLTFFIPDAAMEQTKGGPSLQSGNFRCSCMWRIGIDTQDGEEIEIEQFCLENAMGMECTPEYLVKKL